MRVMVVVRLQTRDVVILLGQVVVLHSQDVRVVVKVSVVLAVVVVGDVTVTLTYEVT